jgi:hypothetical protein
VYKGCAPLRFFILLQLLIKKKINGKVEAIISGVEWNWSAAQSAEWLELRRATPMKTKKLGLTKMQKDHLRYTR